MTKAEQKTEALRRLNEEMRVRRYSGKTIETYQDWVGQYVDYISRPGRGATRDDRINGFLSELVIKKNVSAATQKQALNPQTTMIYLHCVKVKTDVPSPLDVMLRRAA